jgi:hypothetical protein
VAPAESESQWAQPVDLTGVGDHPISEWDYFTVSALCKGSPFTFGHTMHVNICANAACYKH